jgi:hypothetical protein
MGADAMIAGGPPLIGFVVNKALQDHPHDPVVLAFALATAAVLIAGGVIGLIRNW